MTKYINLLSGKVEDRVCAHTVGETPVQGLGDNSLCYLTQDRGTYIFIK